MFFLPSVLHQQGVFEKKKIIKKRDVLRNTQAFFSVSFYLISRCDRKVK